MVLKDANCIIGSCGILPPSLALAGLASWQLREHGLGRSATQLVSSSRRQIKMKQLLQNLRDGRTSVEEVPPPVARPGTALVKTAVSLVSVGTERMVVEFARQSLLGKARRRPDLVRQVLDRARQEGLRGAASAAFRRLDQPMALGYSSAGTIVALGTGMSGFKIGQRVACAGGGYAVHAEYAVVPRNLLAVLPKSVDFESAAFATLGAIGMHGFRLAQPQVGESVAVIGLGLLGLLTIQIAAAAGCQVFGVDVDPSRVKLAAALGYDSSTRPNALETGRALTAQSRVRRGPDLRGQRLQRPGRAGGGDCTRSRANCGNWSGGSESPTAALLRKGIVLHQFAVLWPGALRRIVRRAAATTIRSGRSAGRKAATLRPSWI